MKVTYEQAQADHDYLWSFGPAHDMTGAYIDQEDLERLLRKPTKATARDCYIRQIIYWLQTGPDTSTQKGSCVLELERLLEEDEQVQVIYERYVGSYDEDEE